MRNGPIIYHFVFEKIIEHPIRKLQTDDLPDQVQRKSRPRTGDVDLHQGASGAACGGDRFGVEAGSDASAMDSCQAEAMACIDQW